MKKFAGKYRIPSARAPWWDYANDGAYFVTICTSHRECFFGDIINGKMHHSPLGEIVRRYWMEIPDHFPNVELGAFQIMPNHVHGIVMVKTPNPGVSDDDKTDIETDVKTPNLGVFDGNTNVETHVETPKLDTPDGNIYVGPNVKTPKLDVSTVDSVQTIPVGGKNDRWHKGVLGVIINQYKRKCTIESRKSNPNFAWQTRFYDIIIRDSTSYNTITEYIQNNPANWKKDKFHYDL